MSTQAWKGFLAGSIPGIAYVCIYGSWLSAIALWAIPLLYMAVMHPLSEVDYED
jgi:hypothetical protein